MFRHLSRAKKIFLVIGCLLFLCIIVIGIGLFRPSYTPRITDAQGNVIPGSIASLEKIRLGGVEQWILIRGNDTTNPILLFLHGGPGAPMMVMQRPYLGGLEKDFVVVQWDQRGAGKSYSAIVPNADMNIRQFISDTHELTEFLRRRFHQKKIYLIGHSWGTTLGVLAARKYPESYYAYIGIGQMVNSQESYKLRYAWTLQQAQKAGNEKDVATLRTIGVPPYTGDYGTKSKAIGKLVTNYGGEVYGNPNGSRAIGGMPLMTSTEYTMMDSINFIRGAINSGRLLDKELMQVDLRRQVPALNVPAYFLEGRHDYVTPSALAEQYYEILEAPHKELIWFDNSAHMVPYEEFDKFRNVLVHHILPATYVP
jgi:pimeloyl-ACP methyl ester carboxylesterase